jgi:hypothetical protein
MKGITATHKAVVFNCIAMLQSLKGEAGMDVEQIEVAVDCLKNAFALTEGDGAKYSITDFVKTIGELYEKEHPVVQSNVDGEIMSKMSLLVDFPSPPTSHMTDLH